MCAPRCGVARAVCASVAPEALVLAECWRAAGWPGWSGTHRGRVVVVAGGDAVDGDEVLGGVLAGAALLLAAVVAVCELEGGIRGTVRQGEPGPTCPPGGPGALAATIARFVEQKLGAAMAPHIAQLQAEHSWAALAESAVDLVDELKPARGWS